MNALLFTGLYALGSLASIDGNAIHDPHTQARPELVSKPDMTEPAVLVKYRLRDCELPLLQRTTEVHKLAVGKCHKMWSSFSFRIRTPAVCPDGSLARLALYADQQCNAVHTWMNPDSNYFVHVDIEEEDVGDGDEATCFDAGEVDPPRYRRKQHDYFDSFIGRHGIAFVCEGTDALVVETTEESSNFVIEDHSRSKHEVVSVLPKKRPLAQDDSDEKPQQGGSIAGLISVLAIFALIALLMLATALYRFAAFATWIMVCIQLPVLTLHVQISIHANFLK